MARPSKYTKELVDQIVGYIADGLTIRDTCYGAGISEDTFWRWNREKVEFAEAIKKATNQQKWSSSELMRTAEYRRYTRKARIHSKRQKPICAHIASEKPSEQALRASDGIISQRISRWQPNPRNILPTRSEAPTNAFGKLVFSEPYYNQTTDRVEWIEKETYGRYVLHSCRVEVWEEKGLDLIDDL